jgi:hypothetical protein
MQEIEVGKLKQPKRRDVGCGWGHLRCGLMMMPTAVVMLLFLLHDNATF